MEKSKSFFLLLVYNQYVSLIPVMSSLYGLKTKKGANAPFFIHSSLYKPLKQPIVLQFDTYGHVY